MGSDTQTGSGTPRGGARLGFTPNGVTLALALVVLVVPWIGQLTGGDRNVKFGLAAPDTFYYLTVARNVVEHGVVSFDQTHPTNGFHPLWQIVCAGAHAVGSVLGMPADGMLVFVLALGLACIAVGVVALGRALAHGGMELSPFFVVVPAGFYAVVMVGLLGAHVRWTTLWGYANGMESGLLLGLYGALAWLWMRLDETRGWRQAVGFGIVCGLLALSRLDHAVLPLWILATATLGALVRGEGTRLRFWLIATTTTALVLIAYVAINLTYAGAALPVSGSVKSTFPHPVRDGFVHTVNFFRDPDAIGTTLRMRLAQLVVPFLAALVWGGWMLFRRRRSVRPRPAERRAGRHRRKGARTAAPVSGAPAPLRAGDSLGRFEVFLVATAWAVVFVFLYDYLFVRPYDQGFWYTPVSVLFVSLVALHALGRRRWHERLVRSTRLRLMVAGVLATLTWGFHAVVLGDPGGQAYGHFYYVNAPEARAHYALEDAQEPPRLFSNDDGIVAWATGFPTMNATGVMLDTEAARVFGRGYLHMFELAWKRGFRLWTSCTYTRGYREGIPVHRGMSEAELRSWQGLAPHEFAGYELQLDFVSSDGLFAVSRLVPRRAGGAGGGGRR